MDPKVREGEAFVDDNSAKKKFKFKSFKKFFGKKKRKETLPSLGASGLKQSQSASDVTVPDSLHADYDSEDEDELKATTGVLGSRAVSHDSIFIPEVAQETARPIRVFSQENVSDRIKALQLKLQSNIKVGPPPFGLLSKRSDDAGTSSEDDGLPRSPPEMSLIHEAIKTRFSDIHRHHHSSLSLAGTGSEEDEQISSETSSRPLSPDETELKESHNRYPEKRESTILSPSADFSSPPQYSTFLDNSAARHRLSVKPRNQRLTKNRRPSVALQEESFKNLTCMEEEDVTAPRPEEAAYSSTEAGTPNPHNILDVTLENSEASSESSAVNEPLNLPELVQDRSTSESENVISATGASNIELGAEIKDSSEFLCGRLSENVSICLPTEEKEVLDASLTNNQKLTSEEIKALADVNVKPYVVEEAIVHSSRSRTTSLGLSLEFLNSRRSLFQNSLSEKHLNYQDRPLSDKENRKQLGSEEKKVEKTPTETVTHRKFSVTSAWERPRTGSFSLKANVENSAHKTTKLSLLKPGMCKTEIVKEEPKVAGSNTENKPISRKTETLTDPEGMPVDKTVLANITQNQCAVPAASELPVVTESQSCSEDTNPFSVKLRSTSLSLRYRNGMNPVSSMVKRHSAEFKQVKTAELSFSKEEFNTEKAEIKDHDVLSSKSENAKGKSDATEGNHAKPPLPKKPVLQNITVADNNTNKEASENPEKKINCSEAKTEKKVPDRRPSFSKTIDKNSSVGTAESKTEPSWMSMARQKQRSLKEDRSVSEQSIVNQDSEKQNKDRTEVYSKQQIDLIQSRTTSTSVSVLPESYGQDTKAERSEQRPRANTLPHPVHATQLSLLTEKEETLHKRQTFPVSQEPSWMELAKKKSQAWSDKPHIIK